jgi:uncharacterized phage-associated protein
MISAGEVAKYFLAKVDDEVGDGISNLTLQKLVYYAQAFHLAMHDAPLFGERVEAWEHGPVVPDLYHAYKEHGSAHIPPPAAFDLDAYDEKTRDFLNEVYDVFGQFSAGKLRHMTHDERPWIEASRHGRSDRVISPAAMRDFYQDYVTA